MTFICHPKCTTCRKSKDCLDGKDIKYGVRDIKVDDPACDELESWFTVSGLLVKSFFDTSGLLYKSLKLKDKLATMSEDECLKPLAADGMLVKRPLSIGEGFALAWFKESEWSAKLK